MSHLIDTNGWIGFFEGRKDFSAEARRILTEEGTDCYISLASVWEAAIKVALGKLKLPYDLENDLPRLIEDNGFELLGIELADATGITHLEHLHGDPFDRLMVVQARRRGLRVISRDPVFDAYGLRRVW